MRPQKLYRTIIVIWTEYDPSELELVDLAHEATSGEGYCSLQGTEVVTDPAQFPATDFFDLPDEP